MKYYLLVLAVMVSFIGCGGESNKNGQKSKSNDSKAVASDIWKNASVQTNLLLDDFALLGAVDTLNPDFCYKLGHLVGRAASIGWTTEELVKYMKLDSEQFDNIAVPASMVQLDKTSPKGCNDTFLRTKEYLEQLAEGLSEATQYIN